MNFTIPKEYLVSIVVVKEHWPGGDRDNLSNEDLLRVIKHGVSSSYSSEDHPEFTKLREQLREQGFVEIERRWWNGDRVLRPFTLNGLKFDIGDQFPCAAAAGTYLEVRSRYKDEDDLF